MEKINIFWFRRDLRTDDNHGLYRALSAGLPVLPVFVFDSEILNALQDKDDARLTFIHDSLAEIHQNLVALGSGIRFFHTTPILAFQQLVAEYKIQTVFTNEDYEPYARIRDKAIADFLQKKGIAFEAFKDQVVYAKDDILKDNGTPYTVFTPYSKKWKALRQGLPLDEFDSATLLHKCLKYAAKSIPTLKEMGFVRSSIVVPGKAVATDMLKTYADTRNRVDNDKGTSRISVHLRFGTVSIRKLTNMAMQHSESWHNELIWREFFMTILWHFPHTVAKAFKPSYDAVQWENNEEKIARWQLGTTGFPLVDAGMRELKATGFMHNRTRMVVASFLCKDLLTDWRVGEAWFARYLLDFDLAQNVGNWQWAAGSGCDAAPYFRVFNPELQAQKFDPEQKYIKKWVPEYGTDAYPRPMINRDEARLRTLKAYEKALKEDAGIKELPQPSVQGSLF